MLETILTQKTLNVVNNGSATHTSGTVIDLTIVSPILETDLCW